jgi:ribosomal-protein-alanine N-acetyltransferase
MNMRINAGVFDSFPELESGDLVFRSFKLADAGFIYKIRSNPKVMEFMDAPTHKSLEDSENMVGIIRTAYCEMKGINWIIASKETGEQLGYFGFWRLMPDHCRGEIGYALSPDYWGKGIMKEALKRMIEFGFNDLCLHSIEANVNPGNISSIKLLERAGFKQEAYFRENYLFDGKYYDSLIYSLLETDV